VVCDGYVTLEDDKYDALFVEAGERGAEKAFVLAQRYKPKKGLFSRMGLIERPLLVEDCPNRLTPSG